MLEFILIVSRNQCTHTKRLLLKLPLHFYYRPQRSWGKVIFSQASVILFRGGGSASVHAGIPPPRPGRQPPRPGRHPPGTRQAPPQSRAYWEIRSTCGWYASYWNAVLLFILPHCALPLKHLNAG